MAARLFPLFDLYSEEAIYVIKEKTTNLGVKVQRETIKMSRFVEEIALLANTERELEEASFKVIPI